MNQLRKSKSTFHNLREVNSLTYRGLIYKIKHRIRHKLEKYPNFQKFTTSLYLQYCSLTGFLHILPDYYIIGFPKCGTTSLHEYLGRHPCVHNPVGKEFDFFDRLYFRGLNWYRVHFPFTFHKDLVKNILKKDFITGEATPRYIVHPHALQRIKKTTPQAKFIILLRNPIDRAFSHHAMNLDSDYEYLSFEDALKREKQRINGRYEKMQKNENYYSWDYDIYAYLEHSIYYPKIKRWFSEFPRDQFLIIQTEEFEKDIQKTYKKVLQFLNLPEWKLDTIKFYKKRDYRGSKIDPSTRKQLAEFFRSHNERLHELLGVNFHWDE